GRRRRWAGRPRGLVAWAARNGIAPYPNRDGPRRTARPRTPLGRYAGRAAPRAPRAAADGSDWRRDAARARGARSARPGIGRRAGDRRAGARGRAARTGRAARPACRADAPATPARAAARDLRCAAAARCRAGGCRWTRRGHGSDGARGGRRQPRLQREAGELPGDDRAGARRRPARDPASGGDHRAAARRGPDRGRAGANPDRAPGTTWARASRAPAPARVASPTAPTSARGEEEPLATASSASVFFATSALVAPPGTTEGGLARRGEGDAVALAQVGCVERHLIAFIQAGGDLDLVGAADACLDGHALERTVVDDHHGLVGAGQQRRPR